MIGELKPYPARKDSGVEWLGEVPAHWDVYRMSSGGWVVQPECAAACTRRRTDLGSSHDQAGNWTGFSWRSRSGRWRRRAVDGSSCHKQYWILPGGISVWAEARGVAGSIERDHGLQPGEHGVAAGSTRRPSCPHWTAVQAAERGIEWQRVIRSERRRGPPWAASKRRGGER